MNDRCKTLYTSIVGSHAWRMEHKDSDWDYATIYLAPSDDILTGMRYDRGANHSGEFSDGVPWDQTFMELGKHIHLLTGGNISQVVTLLAPSIPFVRSITSKPNTDWKHRVTFPTHTQKELYKIVTANPAKNIFHSINGMTTANLRKYFGTGKRYSWDAMPDTDQGEWYRTRGKKLAQIERLVRFGYAVLTDQKYELKGCKLGAGEFVDEYRVRQWQKDLVHAYNASDLPEKPDQQPFMDFLLDARLDDIIVNYEEMLSDIYLSPPDY